MSGKLTEVRCKNCGHLLVKAELKPGSVVEVKCKCKTVNTVVAR